MMFKGPQSSIEFQSSHEDTEHKYVCYDCNLIASKVATDEVYGMGHFWIANLLDAMDHLRLHIKHGDMVPPELIKQLQESLLRRSFVHQSVMSPCRRCDGSSSAKRELAFHEEWMKENDEFRTSHLSRDLMSSWGIKDETPREVAIMASLVQWLGTNVGLCFLESSLKRCGYRIVKDKSDGK